jgi:hypothetical protein
MPNVLNRIHDELGEAVLRAGRVSVAEIIARLESGEPPARLASTSKIDAADIIAALAFGTLGADPEGPSLAQSEPTRPGLARAVTDEAISELLPGTNRPARLALAAGLCQILDFWEASHEAAQEADDLGEQTSAAYWHGIAHRREPDAGNAAYWFRRVGRHPVFEELATSARPLLEVYGDRALTSKLIARSGWDPFAMIDLCTHARSGAPAESIARRLQRLEMLALLGATAAAAGVSA